MASGTQGQTAGPSAFSVYASRFLIGKGGSTGRGGPREEGSQVSESLITLLFIWHVPFQTREGSV